jgi:hypothetical protein
MVRPEVVPPDVCDIIGQSNFKVPTGQHFLGSRHSVLSSMTSIGFRSDRTP